MLNIVLIILGMSLEAVIAIGVVLILRFGFRRLPKIYSCILWMLVLIRLLCPVALTSSMSLMPDIWTLWEQEDVSLRTANGDAADIILPENITTGQLTGNPGPEHQADALLDLSGADGGTDAVQTVKKDAERTVPVAWQEWKLPVIRQLKRGWNAYGRILGLVWAAGAGILAAVYLRQYLRLQKQLKDSLKERKRVGKKELILENSSIREPFVYGIFRPVICLPEGMEEKERNYILWHERMHIRHLDPLVRFLWQTALVIHWFNPLVWMALSLVQKDMEMYCDESVMRKCGNGTRKEYAMTLLHFSMKKSGLPFPVAFGESDTESRIHHILKVKKPALAVSLLAGAAIIFAAVFLLTDPESSGEPAENARQTEHQEPEESESGSADDRTEQMLSVGRKWAEAFSDRNGSAMAELVADESIMAEYWDEDGYYVVGWSSPWPSWYYDYQINYSLNQDEVIIYYYPRTSDPRVWVWKDVLTLVMQEGSYMVADRELSMESISSVEEFVDRYHDPDPEQYGMSRKSYRFLETPLDMTYPEADGMSWGSLLLNAENSSSADYLLNAWGTPEDAAETHLDLAGGEAVHVESPWEDTVCLRWKFDDGMTDVICLTRLSACMEDGGSQDSALWVVRNILEEQEYETAMQTGQTIKYYLSDPEELAAGGLKGTEGLISVMEKTDAAVVEISRTPDESVALYGLVSEGNMQGIFLRDNESVQYFDRSFTSPLMVLPNLNKADYDGDGQDELSIVFHVFTGTGVSIEELYLLEKQTDGTWKERKFTEEEYLGQLETEIECIYDEEAAELQYRDIKNDRILGKQDLTEIISDGDHYEGVDFCDIVSFVPEDDGIYLQISPGIMVNGWGIRQYTDTVLRARVVYDGNGFCLEDFGLAGQKAG